MDAPSASESQLKGLERELEELKTLYDQFFAGINKVMPIKEHDSWTKKFRNFPQAKLSSTSDRFRFRNLQARHSQLNGMWQKIIRQIEEGRWVRDKFSARRASLKQEKKTQPLSSKERELINSLYAKIEKSRDKKTSSVSQEKFVNSMEAKLLDFKSKHPNQSINLKLTKDANGQVKLQIKAGEKKKT